MSSCRSVASTLRVTNVIGACILLLTMCEVSARGSREDSPSHHRHHGPSPSPPGAEERVDEASYERELCVIAAFFVASFVHGVAGFGAGMASMAILPVRLPMTEATPVCAVFALFVTLSMTVTMRGALGNANVRATLPALVLGAGVGVPLGQDAALVVG